MRYLFLIDKKFPYKNGETFLENEIQFLAKNFDEVFIFPIDVGKKDIQTRGTPYSEMRHFLLNRIKKEKKKPLEAFMAVFSYLKYRKSLTFEEVFIRYSGKKRFRKIKKILSDFKLKHKDEITIYSYWFYETAYIGNLLKEYLKNQGFENIKLISRAHRFDIYEEQRLSGKLPYRELLLEAVDIVSPISENGTEYFKKNYPRFSNKVITSRLGTLDRTSSECKKNKTEKFNILSISRITEVKRVHKIAEVLATFSTELKKKVHWTHIGTGPELNEVKKIISENNLDNVVTLKGYTPNEQVYEYLNENPVSLFLNVSSSEGIPVSIMEASSFGIPIIATDVGGTSEIVVHSKNGLLINKDFTNEELKKKIELFFFMNSDQFDLYGKNSRKIWNERFNAQKNYDFFVKNILLVGE
ncbi:glycosyltransferase [Tetragenococcus halophilus]|uniref:glycosyltransferase n=1 Tax=Tetragenococcus halophilus TaxID=51669 RepID=UPI000B9273AD|nr:glycosyltransferase [Tetragenococcus halophilus]GFK23624.1 glycosyl transferase family 1 [Tetragenococcus halophilus]